MLLPFAYILFVLNLLWIIPIIYPLLVWKLVFSGTLRNWADNRLLKTGELWIKNNYRISQLLYKVNLVKIGPGWDQLQYNKSYMIIANHQSWADIYIIQSLLNKRIPLIRFFLKNSLKYVPILGHAWMALDFPFVRRSTKEQLKKNPDLANRDLENVKEVCKRFEGRPFAILNFLEGTRKTPQRMAQLKKKNPYENLLRPHSSGISVVSTALKNSIDGFLDLTIIYPVEEPSFLDLMQGKIREVKIHLELIPVAAVPIEVSEQYAPLSKQMKRWVDARWEIKDQLLSQEKQKW